MCLFRCEQCVSLIFWQYSFSRKSPGVGDVVSLAQLSRVKLASTAFSAQLSWFGRALLAPAVRHLKVRPLLIYNLDKPQIIGSFSINADREFVDDKSQLKFFRAPKDRVTRVRFDLNKGLDKVMRKDEDKCKDERISR